MSLDDIVAALAGDDCGDGDFPWSIDAPSIDDCESLLRAIGE